jgi:hypothetical protein
LLPSGATRCPRLTIPEDRSPSLLIPLARRPDFLLVSDTHVSVYKNVLSGTPRRTAVPIPAHILTPLRPGDSKNMPLWVQWDKPLRNPEFPKEAFYIAREDGRVMYVEQGPAGTVDVDDAGEWPYRIDTAFACLSVNNTELAHSYPDILVAGGAGSDGLVCRVGAWPTEYSYTLQYPGMNQFAHVESIPNWAPVTDLFVTNLSGARPPNERDRPAIFVANGNTPHGGISELRFGLQALVDGSFSGIKGCTGLWIVDYGSQTVKVHGKSAIQHYVLFLIALPPESLLIRIIRTQPESHDDFSGAWEDGTWDVTQMPTEEEPIEDAVSRDDETVSACLWSEHFVIQITRKDARILRRPILNSSDTVSFGSPLLLAASSPCFPFIAVTFRESGKTYLEIIHVSPGGKFALDMRRLRHELGVDATCLELFEVGGNPYVFVGTLDSNVTLFKISPNGELCVVLESPLTQTSTGMSRVVCESAVLLAKGERLLLACATRDGFLLSSPLTIPTESKHLDSMI